MSQVQADFKKEHHVKENMQYFHSVSGLFQEIMISSFIHFAATIRISCFCYWKLLYRVYIYFINLSTYLWAPSLILLLGCYKQWAWECRYVVIHILTPLIWKYTWNCDSGIIRQMYVQIVRNYTLLSNVSSRLCFC